MRFAIRLEILVLFPLTALLTILVPAWLLYVVASATNPDRRGRSNPRHAKRSLRYHAKSANQSKPLEPRKPLTLFILCASSQGLP